MLQVRSAELISQLTEQLYQENSEDACGVATDLLASHKALKAKAKAGDIDASEVWLRLTSYLT